MSTVKPENKRVVIKIVILRLKCNNLAKGYYFKGQIKDVRLINEFSFVIIEI